MERTRSAEASTPGWREHAETLLEVARSSIEHGLATGRPLEVDENEYPPALREKLATFVTLRRRGALRGCTGVIEPRRPLVRDVAINAYRSAFEDPRFLPLAPEELEDLDIHISVLSPLEPVSCASEEELLAKLRPGVDGLVLHEGYRSATFLPAVWQQVPEPRKFLAELKRKAGLPADYWSPSIRFERYQAEEIG